MDVSELAATLRSAVSALHKGLRKQLYSVHSYNNYSMTEMETIGHLLRNDALLPTELAALARVKTQSMSQILKKLEEQNIIRRVQSETDKRKVYISMTPFGREMVEKIRYDRDERLKVIIEQTLTDEEKQQLENVLPILNKLAATK